MRTIQTYNYTPIEILGLKTSSYFWIFVDYIACKMEKFAQLYEKSISTEYKRESKMFDISASKNILHIGCGAYPVTAMTLEKMNGKKIVAIDSNPKAVELAKQVINKKKINDKISIENGDGTNYPVKEFDAIIISGCSVPKIQVLKHVINTAKPNSKIIVRELFRTSSLITQIINSYENIELIKKITNTPFPFFRWKSFYLIKK